MNDVIIRRQFKHPPYYSPALSGYCDKYVKTDTVFIVHQVTIGQNWQYKTYGANQITEFPQDLPDTIQDIKITHQAIGAIDRLPPATRWLICEYDNLYRLPAQLPDTLQFLSCENNQLRELPEKLPEVLQQLYCSHNRLVRLPTELPAGLMILWCEGNEITALPDKLPEELYKFVCSKNQLTALPPLPPHMRDLYCEYNNLRELPSQLPENMDILDCSHNQLTLLPDVLPSYIFSKLVCCYNKLSVLPDIIPDGLDTLDCRYNRLTILPDLPGSIEELRLVPGNALDANYPHLFECSTVAAQIQYINMRNRELRKKWLDVVNKDDAFAEAYARRTMHPSRLTALLNDPDIDVDAFMCSHVARL